MLRPILTKRRVAKRIGRLRITQIGERYGGEGVDSHGNSHHDHIFGMPLALHGFGDRAEECQHGHDKQRGGHGKRYERGGVDLQRILEPVMVGEAEEPGLHAVGEDDEGEGHYRVHVGDHSVFGRGEHGGVERYQTPVEKPAYDGAEAVDGGVLGQTFYSCHDDGLFRTATALRGRSGDRGECRQAA